MCGAGASSEAIASAVHERRRLTAAFKEVAPEPWRSRIHIRTPGAYGDPVGPTIQNLRARGRSWDDIVNSVLSQASRDDSNPMHPAGVVAEVSRAAPERSILLSDVGAHHSWCVQQLEVPRDAMFLQSGGSATMGFGVGAAIGAAFVADGRGTVIAVVGDGGFLTHPSAVATAVEHDLPIIWVVWNNAGYVSIRDLQRGFFGKERKFLTRFRKNGFGDLMSTDFAMLGRAMGAAGVHADNPASLGDAITTAIRKKIPTVIDVKIMAHAMRHAAGSWDLAAIAGPAPSYDLDPVR